MNLPKEKKELKKEYFSWLNKNQENHKPIISNAIDAIYNIYYNQFDSTDLKNLKKGLELNHTICWALGEHVNRFAESNEKLMNLLKELSKHSSSKVRLNIITNCLYDKPKKLIDNLLLEALNDKSKKVRLKACDVLLRLNKEKLAYKLLERTKIETDKETKKTLIWTYELLSKKWSYDSDWIFVNVNMENGKIHGFIPENKNDIEWIEKKVKEIRNENQ